MPAIQRFEDLDVWKTSLELNDKIGAIIDRGAFNNNFRFINQLEGSSGSVMDNIAGGFERGSRAEFIQFLGYSKGSCGEFRSQLYRALNRKNITEAEFETLYQLSVRISSMLQKFILYLQKTNINGIRRK